MSVISCSMAKTLGIPSLYTDAECQDKNYEVDGKLKYYSFKHRTLNSMFDPLRYSENHTVLHELSQGVKIYMDKSISSQVRVEA